jgi:ABC-type sugar transport system substrate-binding protein
MRKKSLLTVPVALLLAVGVASSSAAAPNSSWRRGWVKPSASAADAATGAAEAAAKDAKERLVVIGRLTGLHEIDLPPVGEQRPR